MVFNSLNIGLCGEFNEKRTNVIVNPWVFQAIKLTICQKPITEKANLKTSCQENSEKAYHLSALSKTTCYTEFDIDGYFQFILLHVRSDSLNCKHKSTSIILTEDILRRKMFSTTMYTHKNVHMSAIKISHANK